MTTSSCSGFLHFSPYLPIIYLRILGSGSRFFPTNRFQEIPQKHLDPFLVCSRWHGIMYDYYTMMIWTHTHTHMYLYIYINICLSIYIHTYIYTYIYIHIQMMMMMMMMTMMMICAYIPRLDWQLKCTNLVPMCLYEVIGGLSSCRVDEKTSKSIRVTSRPRVSKYSLTSWELIFSWNLSSLASRNCCKPTKMLVSFLARMA